LDNKIINITILLLLVLFISFRISLACEQMDRDADATFTESEQIDNLPVTFSGQLPCADCPAIDYYLLIEEDGFTGLSWYRDRSPDPFEESGRWELRDDTLSIYDGDDTRLKTFLYNNDRLTLLDTELQEITGELADHYVIETSPEEASIRQRHNELRDEGVRFLASGNEPFWNIRIDDQNRFSYRSMEREWSTDLPEGSESSGASKTYRLEIDSDTLTMIVKDTYCRDSMSGFLFTHTVTLQKDGEPDLHGCGRFLN
jgi:uncharacterized membrane protein